MSIHTEASFEGTIEAHLLNHGYTSLSPKQFDCDRALFPEPALHFIQQTQPQEWQRLKKLHGDNTATQILSDLCKWLDQYGSLQVLRHGFKCYGRTLRIATEELRSAPPIADRLGGWLRCARLKGAINTIALLLCS